MGIVYTDSIILYNRVVDGVMESEKYFGTRFDNVRIELTQGSRIASTGNENADACIVKIPMEIAGAYIAPEKWNQLPQEEKLEHFTLDKGNKNFFIIVKKESLGIYVDLPVGEVDSSVYAGGYFQYVSNMYGYAYQLKNVDVYELIPRFEIGGR